MTVPIVQNVQIVPAPTSISPATRGRMKEGVEPLEPLERLERDSKET